MKKLCVLTALLLCAAMLFGCAPKTQIEQPVAEQPAAEETPAETVPAQEAGEGEAARPSMLDMDAALAAMLNGDGGMQLAAWQEFTGSAKIMDGTTEVPVSVEIGDEDACSVIVDYQNDDLQYFYNVKSYVADIDDRDGYTELIVTGDSGSDDYDTRIYRVVNGLLQQVTLYGCALGGDGKGTLLLDGAVDVLGTYGAQYEYTAATETLNFARSSVYTRVRSDDDWEYLSLTVKKDGLPVRSADGASELTLPAGTKLLMIMTDGESEAALMDEADSCYRVSVERNEAEWGWLIGGISENEWFDYVPYSG